jgi:hypothetical protein
MQAYLIKVLMYGSKMFRVAKATVPLDPNQQEQRTALGKLIRLVKAAVPLEPTQQEQRTALDELISWQLYLLILPNRSKLQHLMS